MVRLNPRSDDLAERFGSHHVQAENVVCTLNQGVNNLLSLSNGPQGCENPKRRHFGLESQIPSLPEVSQDPTGKTEPAQQIQGWMPEV